MKNLSEMNNKEFTESINKMDLSELNELLNDNSLDSARRNEVAMLYEGIMEAIECEDDV